MKREARLTLSEEGQLALEQYAHVLQQIEDLSTVTIRNYLSGLRQFMAWWHETQEERLFTPQAVAPPLLIRYRAYLQTSPWLKPSIINRTIMSLKRYFAWVTKMGSE